MTTQTFPWAVVGAGPAGIAVVGKLLDNGIAGQDILWIDPEFAVGDFGKYWKNVSSNTRVKLFLDFLNACKAFNYSQSSIDFAINHLAPDETCPLSNMVQPLQWITDSLVQQVHTKNGFIHQLTLRDQTWTLDSTAGTCHAKNVVLAIGAAPCNLDYPDIKTISFEDAIDKTRLQQKIQPHETMAVFGSSHSAIMIIRHLVESGVKKVINFYRSPCRYAVDMGDWILFDNQGLKGETAKWAKTHIDGTWPKNLVRYTSTDPWLQRHLPEADKVIYATGFKSRENILLNEEKQISHNPYTGIIGPGLFGLGIAFPEKKTDPSGNTEMQVGLWKFMVYLNRVLDIWFKYSA